MCSCAVPTADAVATGSLIFVWLHSLTQFVETFDIQDTAGQCNDPSLVMMIHTLNTVLGLLQKLVVLIPTIKLFILLSIPLYKQFGIDGL